MRLRALFISTMLIGSVTAFLVTSHFRTTADAKKIQHFYSTAYYGLQVGRAKLPEVFAVLGQPLSKKINSNNVLYTFKDVAISIEDATQRINTIIITKPGFVDVNGYFTGAAYSVLARDPNILDDNNIFSYILTDKKNGVIYHFKDDQVIEIVYVSSLFL